MERNPRLLTKHVPGFAIVAPTVFFMAVFFVLPMTGLLRNSFELTTPGGAGDGGWTLANYLRFFSSPFYLGVLATTVRVAALTTLAAAILAYSVAWKIAFGSSFTARLLTLVVVSPLLINIVIRTFGWRIALGKTGVINWALQGAGIIQQPLDLLYTEFAIVIGSLHVFFPLMVLPLAANLARLDPALGESAATLGASRTEIFFRIVLPLTIPGLAAGASLVFTLTSSSFVLPAVLGGGFQQMLGTILEEQTFAVADWGFASAIATVLMAVNLLVVSLLSFAVERQLRLREGVT